MQERQVTKKSTMRLLLLGESNLKMNIIQNIIPESKWNIKCPYSMTPEFIVVHNTANDALAENEIANMRNNNKKISFHIAVDDKKAIQGIPFDRNAFHSGDGTKGKGNRKGIGIEICYSKSGGDKFSAAENNAVIVIAGLLKEFGWGVDKVKKHQDFSGKYCPHRTLDLGWQRFLDKIAKELNKSEEIDMEELEKLRARVKELEELNKVYDQIDETMPKWIQQICVWALSNNIISGTGSGLGMTKAKAETLVMIKNALEK